MVAQELRQDTVLPNVGAHPRRLRRASDAGGVGCSAMLAIRGPPNSHHPIPATLKLVWDILNRNVEANLAKLGDRRFDQR
jgi:hypothetical protein